MIFERIQSNKKRHQSMFENGIYRHTRLPIRVVDEAKTSGFLIIQVHGVFNEVIRKQRLI